MKTNIVGCVVRLKMYFDGKLVYQFRIVVCNTNFSEHLQKIVNRYEKRDLLQHECYTVNNMHVCHWLITLFPSLITQR